MLWMYEDLTPEERAAVEADRNPIVVEREEDLEEAMDLSCTTGRELMLPSVEKALEWGFEVGEDED